MKHIFLTKTTTATAFVAVSFSAVADGRIRTETYSPNRVYSIYAEIGKASMVQFEEDERVNDANALVGIGYSEAWTQAARVKYHFWRRFGGAIMISLIGDLGDGYANRQKSSNNQRITFENSSQTAQDMATEALKNSINIPPTAYINHGTLINIMVARDVDFSGVYEVVNPYQF